MQRLTNAILAPHRHGKEGEAEHTHHEEHVHHETHAQKIEGPISTGTAATTTTTTTNTNIRIVDEGIVERDTIIK